MDAVRERIREARSNLKVFFNATTLGRRKSTRSAASEARESAAATRGRVLSSAASSAASATDELDSRVSTQEYASRRTMRVESEPAREPASEPREAWGSEHQGDSFVDVDAREEDRPSVAGPRKNGSSAKEAALEGANAMAKASKLAMLAAARWQAKAVKALKKQNAKMRERGIKMREAARERQAARQAAAEEASARGGTALPDTANPSFRPESEYDSIHESGASNSAGGGGGISNMKMKMKKKKKNDRSQSGGPRSPMPRIESEPEDLRISKPASYSDERSSYSSFSSGLSSTFSSVRVDQDGRRLHSNGSTGHVPAEPEDYAPISPGPRRSSVTVGMASRATYGSFVADKPPSSSETGRAGRGRKSGMASKALRTKGQRRKTGKARNERKVFIDAPGTLEREAEAEAAAAAAADGAMHGSVVVPPPPGDLASGRIGTRRYQTNFVVDSRRPSYYNEDQPILPDV